MRRVYIRKIFMGDMDERFDATKKLSDYVGMLTRLVFLSILSAFIADTLEYSAILSFSVVESLKAVFLLLVLMLNIFFGLAFVSLSRKFMQEALWLDRPKSSNRYLQIGFEFLQPTLVLMTIIGTAAIVVATPLVVTELADRQMHREVKQPVHVPAQ